MLAYLPNWVVQLVVWIIAINVVVWGLTSLLLWLGLVTS